MVRPVAIVLALALTVGCSPASRPANSLSGVVRDPAGKPVPAVWIAREGFKDRSGGTPWWRSDADGRFRLDGLPDGEVVLRVVTGEASLARGVLVRTAAGREDVPIVVEPGIQVLVRIADYRAPSGEPGHARLVWREPDGRRPVLYCPIASDGRMRFVQLPASDSFELWAAAGSNRPVHVTGLKAGEQEIRVEATAGRTITGNALVSSGEDPRRIGVSAEAFAGFRVGRTSLAADGSFVIADLPEGTYEVKAGFTSGAVSVPVKVEVQAGATDVVLDLRR